LIEKSVGNSIATNSKSILITGSNMSGKTTFLRTIAINAILAQSIYTCFAEKYVAPFVRVYSSIRADDNLINGESYYLNEVQTVKSI
jgi:DNA mismatch repair ATPase MutS